MSARPPRSRLQDYPYGSLITTRWHDNDVYGHVNNVQYYAFFDTAVNGFLIERKVLDLHVGEVIGLVVETSCRYFAPLAFPDQVLAAVRVAHLGNSSVRYEIGLFRIAPEVRQDAATEEPHPEPVRAEQAGREYPGPEQPSPDQPGPEQPGPEHPGPEHRRRAQSPSLEESTCADGRPRLGAGLSLGHRLDPETEAVAEGHFVHVYVDRNTRRPRALGPALREVLRELWIGDLEPRKTALP